MDIVYYNFPTLVDFVIFVRVSIIAALKEVGMFILCYDNNCYYVGAVV